MRFTPLPPPPARSIFDGASDLVWAVVGAGPRSALLVFRGSNTPQNWISDVTSFHTTNVADFGGEAGANVAAGFYKVGRRRRSAAAAPECLWVHVQHVVCVLRACAAVASCSAGTSESKAHGWCCKCGSGGPFAAAPLCAHLHLLLPMYIPPLCTTRY